MRVSLIATMSKIVFFLASLLFTRPFTVTFTDLTCCWCVCYFHLVAPLFMLDLTKHLRAYCVFPCCCCCCCCCMFRKEIFSFRAILSCIALHIPSSLVNPSIYSTHICSTNLTIKSLFINLVLCLCVCVCMCLSIDLSFALALVIVCTILTCVHAHTRRAVVVTARE